MKNVIDFKIQILIRKYVKNSKWNFNLNYNSQQYASSLVIKRQIQELPSPDLRKHLLILCLLLVIIVSTSLSEHWAGSWTFHSSPWNLTAKTTADNFNNLPIAIYWIQIWLLLCLYYTSKAISNVKNIGTLYRICIYDIQYGTQIIF